MRVLLRATQRADSRRLCYQKDCRRELSSPVRVIDLLVGLFLDLLADLLANLKTSYVVTIVQCIFSECEVHVRPHRTCGQEDGNIVGQREAAFRDSLASKSK